MTSGSALLTHHSTWPGRHTSTTENRGGNYRPRGRGRGRFSWNHARSARLSHTGRVGGQSLSPTGGLCWHCGRGGHTRRDCSVRRSGIEAQRSGRGGRGGRQFAEVAHTPTVSRALIVTSSHPGNSRSCAAPWLVDSGAS